MKRIIATALALAALATTSAHAFDRSMTVHNNGGYTISGFYLINVGRTDWGQNWLYGGDLLYPGWTLDVDPGDSN